MSPRRTAFDEMDRMFEQMRRSMPGGWHDHDGSGDGDVSSHGDMNLSVETDDEGYVVFADVPGFEREELDLRFDDGLLTITGEHETSERSGTAASARSRRVHERVRLPGEIDADGIVATYRNGVLEVHLPADASDDSRSIEID